MGAGKVRHPAARELLADIQRELGVAYLFISHDLSVVRQIADEVLVLNAGRVVEHGKTAAIFNDPQEQYTRDLLDAVPGRRHIRRTA